MQNVRPRHLTDKELAHICVTESPEDIPPEWVAELAERFSEAVSINGLLAKELEAAQRLAREFEAYCKELEQEAADLEVRLKN